MKPVDRFGSPIYPRQFEQLKACGRTLESLGYKETGTPNLFTCRYDAVTFLADMRGTKFVPIWKEPLPFIYVSARDASIGRVEETAFGIELARLKAGGLKFRIDPRDDPTF